MKAIFLIFCSLFVFLGCSSSQDALHVKSEDALNFSMANSKKVEIIHADMSKTFVTVAYLNPIEHELIKQDTEKFVVGTYIATGDNRNTKIALSKFKINGKSEEVTVSALTKDSEILKLVPSSNPWTDYLLVEAPISLDLTMTFSFETDPSKRVSLVFRKDY